MNLIYKMSDVETMIDAFSSIQENKDNKEVILIELKKLTKYPVNVLREFLNAMNSLEGKSNSYLKENYRGIIAYITMRINICPKNEILDF